MTNDINDRQKKAFLLTNKIGGYTLLSNTPQSRYEGVFFRIKGKMFKVIDELRFDEPVSDIDYSKFKATRNRGNMTETFYMPAGQNALYYQNTRQAEFDLILDCRESYDARKWGRHYELSKEDGCFIVKYSKKNDSREEASILGEYDLYLAIKGEQLDYLPIEQWLPQKYPRDAKRKSEPSQMHVFNACKLRSAKFSLGFAKTKEEAIRIAKDIFLNMNKLARQDKTETEKIIKNSKGETKTKEAHENALYSLYALTVAEKGTYAGLPWFFQYWARDELISLKATAKVKSLEFVKRRLREYLNGVAGVEVKDQNFPFTLKQIDAAGWLFKRVNDFLEVNENFFDAAEKTQIIEKINMVVDSLTFKEGLIYNSPLETWMDTKWENDDREGCRIEIQALILAMLKCYSKIVGKEHKLEKELREKTREKLWNGQYLIDGLGDSTKRPNVFIAAYVYPELLNKKEWENCFDSVLPALWLKWGGLASIDKSHKLFVNEHTGQDNRSYHRGDSWYWINNLAALVLHKVNAEKYKKYIDKILDAGICEILEMGAVGHHAEISSAKTLESRGCFAQAWSAAMFVELIDETCD